MAIDTEKVVAWVLARLGERSTWEGITTAAAAFGCLLSPEQASSIATLGVLFVGAIRAGMADK